MLEFPSNWSRFLYAFKNVSCKISSASISDPARYAVPLGLLTSGLDIWEYLLTPSRHCDRMVAQLYSCSAHAACLHLFSCYVLPFGVVANCSFSIVARLHHSCNTNALNMYRYIDHRKPVTVADAHAWDFFEVLSGLVG